jgi:hypothetical protein
MPQFKFGLKGRGFSRAAYAVKSIAALAAEGACCSKRCANLNGRIYGSSTTSCARAFSTAGPENDHANVNPSYHAFHWSI